jgi:hypothetical protein
MTKEEVVEFVSQVVEHTESNTKPDELVRARVKMAAWLWSRYKIGILELQINANDGMPYLKIQFTNDENKKEEAYISLEKHKERIAKELAGDFNAAKVK